MGMSKVDLSAITDSWVRFEQYAKVFTKTYKDDAEKKHRFMAFLENEEEIAELNAMEGNATFGLTKFSDLTKDEFTQRYLNFVPYSKEKRSEIPVRKPEKMVTVSSLDWREKNAVTAVKDQGDCGSCWAFSAVQTVESAYLLTYTGTDASTFLLSEQQMVSCDKDDAGCNGGDLPYAFNYAYGAKGLTTEAKYPYTSGNSGNTGRCKSFTPLANTTPKTYGYATPTCSGACNNQDEAAMASNMEAVGPIGICVNAAKWQNYYSGVMSASTCGSHRYGRLDHCVQAVGFESIDTDNDGYWIVNNSWADDWGEEGYIYLAYGDNVCGVADEAMFVTV